MKDRATETITHFLVAWKDLDYSKMYEFTQKTWKSKHSKNQLKNLIHSRIKSYKILECREFSPTVYDVDIAVRIKGQQRKITARLITELEPYKLSLEGTFGVNPISIIRNLY